MMHKTPFPRKRGFSICVFTALYYTKNACYYNVRLFTLVKIDSGGIFWHTVGDVGGVYPFDTWGGGLFEVYIFCPFVSVVYFAFV